MKLAYIRCSAADQNESRQVSAMLEAGIDPNNFYIDKQSGKDFNRIQYKALLKAARPDDVIVIKSIDRLGRNYTEIREQWQAITNKGIYINVLDMPLLNTDQVIATGLTGKFISDMVLQVLSFVAEQERDNIRARQAEGIRAAKQSGKVKFGRPTKESKDFTNVADSVKAGKLKVSQAIQVLGISRQTFYNHAKKAGYDFSK